MKAFVCDKWLLYENFYDWIHSQENFIKWKENSRWAIDKDIIKKWNKEYSEEYCCLVPPNVNSLFTRRQNYRGKYPIGVYQYKPGIFRAQCMNPYIGKRVLVGNYKNPDKAFYAYKKYKENLIKMIAKEEYENNNIVKKCYEAMMDYKVEITD